MKIPKSVKHPHPSKSNILRVKAKTLKVSKVAVQDRKNFDEAKLLLENIIANENNLDSSSSSRTSGIHLKELKLVDIMRTINELTAEMDSATECITECSARMVATVDNSWTSPRAILRAIKYCICRRKWENITHLLLLLLHHKDQYVPIVNKLCIFISKFNPMVEKLGLQEEFEAMREKRK